MISLAFTHHAALRLAQRGISLDDAELAAMIGTELDDGYVVRDKDCDEVERELKALLNRVRRLRGKRLVAINGKVVTVYRVSRKKSGELRRRAQERDFHQ